MTKLPDIYATDPDDWYEEVRDEARKLEAAVREKLDAAESLEELRDGLMSHFDPYVIDPDEFIHGEQLLAEIKYGEKLYVGVKNGDWMPLTYRDDEEFWWFDGAEPRQGDGSVEDLHDYLATRIVEATTWGDPQLARQRANEQKEHRRIATPYLEALEQALEAGEPTAAELREEFHRLLNECLESGSEVVVADVSPDDHHTHVRLRHDGEPIGRLLAVDPGAPTDLDEVAREFELEDEERELPGCVTDHRHFKWPRLPESREAVTLRLPSEKDDDRAAYHRALDWVVRNMRAVLTEPDEK